MSHVPETDNLILCLRLRCLKASAYNAGDLGLIPGSGRSPGEGNGNPLQSSSLEKFHEQRNLTGYSPWGCKELDTTERLTLSLSLPAHSLQAA